MVKKICVFILFTSAVVHANGDWLDRAADLVSTSLFHKNHIDLPKLEMVLGKCINEDKKEIESLEKLQKLNSKEEGIVASGHNVSYKAQIAAAKTQLSYHEKVAKSVKDLADNKRDKEKFIERLAELKADRAELDSLEAKMKKASALESVKIGASIAAKKGAIEAKKLVIKGSLLSS